MDTCRTVVELRRTLDRRRGNAGTVGFVPTMGAIHDGHRSLARLARERDSLVVASIFVNPLQFGAAEDLERYPRMPERDAAAMESEGIDVLFLPSSSEIYPPGFATRVDVGRLGALLEGASRPGHFSGVATVVLKLFNVVRADRAYFGQKDAQQLAVIRQIVRDLAIPMEIIAGPTVREPDGLALSSRNALLPAEDRRAAPVLYRALAAAHELARSGLREAEALRRIMRRTIAREARAQLDYAEVVDGATFDNAETITGECLLVIAARFGQVRLIDNMPVAFDTTPRE